MTFFASWGEEEKKKRFGLLKIALKLHEPITRHFNPIMSPTSNINRNKL